MTSGILSGYSRGIVTSPGCMSCRQSREISTLSVSAQRLNTVIEHFAEIKPAVNQMETHVFQQQKVLKEYMDKHNTQLMSWGPFAEGRNDFFTNKVLSDIGAKYGKSVAQTARRFLIQSGVVVIPKLVHHDRIEQNFNVLDFELSAEDMQTIAKLDTGKSLFFSHHDPATVEWFMSIV